MSEKKFVRTNDRLIAGVCGGVAKFLGFDVVVVRVLWVVAALFLGVVPGLVAYGLFWLMAPEEEQAHAPVAIAPQN